MLGKVCVLVIWVSRPYIAQTLAFFVSFSQIINLALSAVYNARADCLQCKMDANQK